MSSLDFETITKLLEGEAAQEQQQTTPDGKHLPAIQVGPLRWMEKSERCASRNCGSPTHITVEGVRRCITHAVYELNRLLINLDGNLRFVVASCTCKAGKYSVGNIHTSNCEAYTQLSLNKEQSGSSSSADDTNLPGEL